MPAWWTTWLWQVRAFGYIRFTTSRLKSQVFCVKLARWKKRTIPSAHRVERLLSSWCGKTQIARIEANKMATTKPSWLRGIRAAGLIWNTWSVKSWLTLTKSVRVLYNTSAVIYYYYDALILGSITIAYIIMTMHDIVFSMNIAGDDECSRTRCIRPTFDAADPSLRRAATCHVRTLSPGPEGVRSWQVLLYFHCSRTNPCVCLVVWV